MHASASPSSDRNAGSSDRSPITLAIDGMSCGHCVGGVTKALQGVPGVEIDRVAVGSASVRVADAQRTTAAAIDAIRDAGYSARVVEPTPRPA